MSEPRHPKGCPGNSQTEKHLQTTQILRIVLRTSQTFEWKRLLSTVTKNKAQISKLKFQITNHKIQITNLKSQVNNYDMIISHVRQQKKRVFIVFLQKNKLM